MKNLIGYPLKNAEKQLKEKNLKYEIVENSFKIEGDEQLITNVKSQDDTIILTVGKFIFDIEENKNEN